MFNIDYARFSVPDTIYLTQILANAVKGLFLVKVVVTY